MAAVNSTISQADYNLIRNKIVAVMGAGGTDPSTGLADPTFGYGQTSKIKSSAIVEGNNVTINEWSNLRYDILNAYNHIFGSVPATYQVIEGDTIRYSAANAPVSAHNTIADTIMASRLSIGAGQYSTDPAGTQSNTFSWKSSASTTFTVTFSNANDARWFFNSGGQVKINSSFVRTSGVNTDQNIKWESLLSGAGTVAFGATTPGTGRTPSNGQNWYRLTNAVQRYYQATGTSPYTANQYNLYASSDIVSNTNGGSITVTFKVEFLDNYIDPDVSAGRADTYHPPGDVVNGTLTVNVSLLYPTTTFVPSGTGTFAVNLPTININPITGS